MSDIALARGEKFLQDNAAKEGVNTTPSGLQYKIVREGEGRQPSATDTVVVHYRGTLIDGTEFDSSYKRGEPIDYELWKVVVELLDWLMVNWDSRDEGIWEVRGGQQNFTYSRLMSWIAFDRALRIAQTRGFPCPRIAWRETRDAIFEQIMTRGYSKDRQAFVQVLDGDVLDASTLMMVMGHFVAPNDPLMVSTIDAIREELVTDSLVYRYDPKLAADDGLSGEEGTFSICSFWWVEALARAGNLEEARLAFEKMHTYANHLGLYSEEIGPSGEALGNFPQAFTHLSLVSAALYLDHALDEHRPRVR